jgi:ubiquinone/menaquinone biosynthesis C-methylase UbiE
MRFYADTRTHLLFGKESVMKRDTSWQSQADWYDAMLSDPKGTYQNEVILPNLLRLAKIKKGEMVLDLACGQGFFSRAFNDAGAKVIGVDLSEKLIDLAKKNSPKEIEYRVLSADNLGFIKDGSIDLVVIVLAIQNIENISAVFKECNRVLKSSGKLMIVLNHPAFRIPQASDWLWDEKKKTQVRRVDKYLTESKIKITTNPGQKESEYSISFHRPLQLYFKALGNQGFAVTRLEEWISHKESEKGPRKEAEDRARKEFPLFLFLEAVKIS